MLAAPHLFLSEPAPVKLRHAKGKPPCDARWPSGLADTGSSPLHLELLLVLCFHWLDPCICNWLGAVAFSRVPLCCCCCCSCDLVHALARNGEGLWMRPHLSHCHRHPAGFVHGSLCTLPGGTASVNVACHLSLTLANSCEHKHDS